MYQPLIESGRWLQAADAGKRYLVVSADTAKLNGIQVGNTLEITIGSVKQAWQVIGIYRWLVAGNYVVEPVYAPLETVRTITQGKNRASFALLKASIANREEEADFLSLLKQRFQDSNIKLDVYNTQAKLKQNQFARNQFNPVLGTLSGLASMIAAVGGIGLSGALAISVMQRTREIGVLSAIGASSNTVYRLFLLEGMLHGLVAWVLSIPLAYLAAEPIAGELGKTMLGIELDFAFDLKAVFYWLGIVLLLTWLASYWPARKASKLRVRECLQH
jgi:putative ABC transport system permease protein